MGLYSHIQLLPSSRSPPQFSFKPLMVIQLTVSQHGKSKQRHYEGAKSTIIIQILFEVIIEQTIFVFNVNSLVSASSTSSCVRPVGI